ncbi:MAG: protein tyrosine phosphatase [Rhizobiaceae bacterium]
MTIDESVGSFLRVSALYRGRVSADLETFRPTHIVSLLDPALDQAKIPSFGAVTTMQRKFPDLDTPGAALLSSQMFGEIVEFVSGWAAARQRGEDARLLVHCHMGASRSTATALISLAVLRGHGNEGRAFDDLMRITNKPWPNYNLVALADDLLDRKGLLIAELLRYRERYPRRLDAYMRLNLRRGQALPDWPST